MHVLARADSSANSPGVWAYLAILAATAADYMDIPLIGTAAIGTAAVCDSQVKLNIAAVLIVVVIGDEIGGLLGYKIGGRWGRQILGHTGLVLEWRKEALAGREAVYQQSGRLAVFFTPGPFFTPEPVSGALRMKYRQFVVWDFLAGSVFALSVGPVAYGAGRVASGDHDLVNVAMLVGGVAVGAVSVALGVRHHRGSRARGSATVGRAEPDLSSGACAPARRRARSGVHRWPRLSCSGSAQERARRK